MAYELRPLQTSPKSDNVEETLKSIEDEQLPLFSLSLPYLHSTSPVSEKLHIHRLSGPLPRQGFSLIREHAKQHARKDVEPPLQIGRFPDLTDLDSW